MDSAWHVLLDVLVLLTAALILGTVVEQLRQSAILGYLLAGTLVGPNVLKLVSEDTNVETVAELGVAMLLFTIGLEFSFRRLRRLGLVALVGGSLQVMITLVAAATIAATTGIGWKSAVAVGAMVALSSTACVLRLLVDRAAVESIYGRNAVGILLLQDIAVIPLMILMVMLGGQDSAATAGLTLLRTVALASMLIGGFYLLFNYVVPRLLNLRRWSSNRELPILLAIVLALGSAWAAHQIGLSPAMGAFIAGVLLGESPFAVQIRADVGPLRTLLLTLFFASIGMLGKPLWVLQNWYLVAGVVVAIVIGKTLIVWGIFRMLRFTHGQSLATGLCVAQVGEFSFVLAEMARGNAITEGTFNLIVSATIVTLFLTPFLVAAAPKAIDRLALLRKPLPDEPEPVPPDVEEAAEALAPSSAPPVRDVFIIGFGPAGESVAQALMRQHLDRLVVVDLNPRNIAVARRYGVAEFLGDATQRDVLEHARIQNAKVIVITVPDPITCRTIIHLCRYLSEDAAIVVRSRYHNRRWELQMAGAMDVVDEEEQVGLRLAAVARRYVGE